MATPYWRSSGTIVIYGTTHSILDIHNTHTHTLTRTHMCLPSLSLSHVSLSRTHSLTFLNQHIFSLFMFVNILLSLSSLSLSSLPLFPSLSFPLSLFPFLSLFLSPLSFFLFPSFYLAPSLNPSLFASVSFSLSFWFF